MHPPASSPWKARSATAAGKEARAVQEVQGIREMKSKGKAEGQ